MITTKAGKEVQIVSGSKKCITGIKPFIVKFVNKSDDLIKKSVNPWYNNVYTKQFKATKNELNYENIEELYEAIGLKKDS